MIRKTKKCLSVFLAVATMITALTFCVNVGSVRADAASWNGTNYGGGSVAGYRTFLEAFGIDYDTYIKWMDDHDDDSQNPDYYLGTLLSAMTTAILMATAAAHTVLSIPRALRR